MITNSTSATIYSPSGDHPAYEPMMIEQTRFNSLFNRLPFEFTHSLQNHLCFTTDRLMELFEKTLPYPDMLYWDAGPKRIDQRWSENPGRSCSPHEALERIRDNGAWMILFGAERDPEIAAVLEQSMQQIDSLSNGTLFPKMKIRSAYIFVTSPHRITTYHIDRECNFLLQVRGEKSIHVFDRTDREILSETEIERFWSVDNNAPQYRPELQSRAQTTLLKPGTGIHIPVNCPHWLQNGSDISVSLSLNFQFKNQMLGNIYRANYYLRKLGIDPIPPGKNSLLDTAKGYGMILPVAAAKIGAKFRLKR